jgi:hypothetical protein
VHLSRKQATAVRRIVDAENPSIGGYLMVRRSNSKRTVGLQRYVKHRPDGAYRSKRLHLKEVRPYRHRDSLPPVDLPST